MSNYDRDELVIGAPTRREIEKHKVFLRMCLEAAKASRCPRRGVGAILVNIRGRVRGHGYNGTPTGTPNYCGSDVCLRDIRNIESGTQLDVGCLHAEMNLIMNSTLEDLYGGTLYCSTQPCVMCAKLIVQAQIARLVCIENSYAPQNGIDFVAAAAIDVRQFKASEITYVCPGPGGDCENACCLWKN